MDLNFNDNSILATIINSIPQYIFWKDKNLVFRGCNMMFLKQFNMENLHDIIGKTDYEFDWDENLREKYRHDDLEVIRSGKAKLHIEEKQKQPDGSFKIVSLSKVPIYDGANVIGVLGVYSDITKEKEAEKLKLQQKEMETRMEVQATLAGNIAHDLQTPLSGIAASASTVANNFEVLVDAYQQAKEHQLPVKKYIQPRRLEGLKQSALNILASVKQCQKKIRFFLANAKQGQVDVNHYKIHDIKRCVEKAIENHPFDSSERELVHVDINPNFKFWGDESAMANILQNLMENALYFIKAEGKGEIYITSEVSETVNTLYFKDTAKGAPADVAAKMFERGFTQRDKGTGFGLAGAKVLVESFRGAIKADTKLGEHMTIIMQFPVVSSSD